MKIFERFGIFLLGVVLFSPFSAEGGSDNRYGQSSVTEQQEEPVTDPLTSYGDSIWSFHYTGDQGLFGIEFDGDYFYLPGNNEGGDSNMVYVFDRTGVYVREFAQKTKNYGPTDW